MHMSRVTIAETSEWNISACKTSFHIIFHFKCRRELSNDIKGMEHHLCSPTTGESTQQCYEAQEHHKRSRIHHPVVNGKKVFQTNVEHLTGNSLGVTVSKGNGPVNTVSFDDEIIGGEQISNSKLRSCRQGIILCFAPKQL